MIKQDKQESIKGPPLARILRLRELPGWLGKRIVVPVGWVGVALYPSGESRLFQPGSHRLLTWWQRQTGQGVGIKVGLVSTSPFTKPYECPYLLSGDGELLDGSLICSLVVNEPARFFSAVVVPRGEPVFSAEDLDPGPVQELLAVLVKRYAVDDLVSGVVTSRLIGQLRTDLAAAILTSQGIGLNDILLLTISRASDRAVIAEKAQALKDRLLNAAVEAKMAEVENQAQLDDFIRQLEPDLVEVAHPQVAAAELEKDKASPKGKLGGAVKSWLASASNPQDGKRWWRLEGLFRRKAKKVIPAEQHIPPRVQKRWWLPRLLWIIFALLIGLGLTGLVRLLVPSAKWQLRLELLIPVWVFVITVVLESLKKLYEKREVHSEDTWMLPGFQRLDDLVGNDRKWADDLVREQCARELNHVREVVADIRSREYQRGKMDLALKIKNEVERNIEACVMKIQRQDYGSPVYVSDLHISQHMWENALDTDENLLIKAHLLSDKTHLLQQQSHADQMVVESVAEVDAEVSKFCNQFFERGRPLQLPTEETKPS